MTFKLEYSGDGTAFSNADQSHLEDSVLTVSLPEDATGTPELEGTTHIKAKLTDANNNTILEKIFQNISSTYGIKAFLNPDLNSIDDTIYRIADNSIVTDTDIVVSNLTKKLLVEF